jgi:hypothetical protein
MARVKEVTSGLHQEFTLLLETLYEDGMSLFFVRSSKYYSGITDTENNCRQIAMGKTKLFSWKQDVDSFKIRLFA